jgi:hypothetical protein
MKKSVSVAAICVFIVMTCSSWGFFAHYRINRMAVFILPKGMSAFYENHLDYITEHAISADKRRYVDSLEAPRHYLNADHYGNKPFTAIPLKWNDAERKYSCDTLDKYGTLPWTIQYQYYKLVKAFKAHDTSAILSTSANLGHYIADATVPLHLTQNYNGQLTGQTGLHAFWESRLPELFAGRYHYFVGKARYVENPLYEAFKICRSSFKEVDSVLSFEKKLNLNFPASKKYEPVKRGKRTVDEYSAAYSTAYHQLLHGMVERRMRLAILEVGSYWFSAWVDAGQPDLHKLIATELPEIEQKSIAREKALYIMGKASNYTHQLSP